MSYLVFDEERGGRHDLIGDGSIDVKNEKLKQALSVFYKNDTAGNLKIDMEFLLDGSE